MITKDVLLKRVRTLAEEVQSSLENYSRIKATLETAANAHNALVGRLDEATKLYNDCEKEIQPSKAEPKGKK